MQSLQKPTPIQWYGEQVVGMQTLSKVIKNLMQSAEIDGYFTNHSARRTGGTLLFQAGVDLKLVKEMTGYTSNAVDKYQVTGDEQRKNMSEILATKPSTSTVGQPPSECHEVDQTTNKTDNSMTKQADRPDNKCVVVNVGDDGNIGELLNSLIKTVKSDKSTKFTIKIEITKE